MTINTKFDVGEQVYFLESGSIYRRPVQRINIEVRRGFVTSAYPQPSLITYYFVLNPNSERAEEFYKYESELAATKEDLITTLQVL